MSLLQVTLGIPIPAREQRVVKINAKIYLNIATVCGTFGFALRFISSKWPPLSLSRSLMKTEGESNLSGQKR
jgi:hypothetical protein